MVMGRYSSSHIAGPQSFLGVLNKLVTHDGKLQCDLMRLVTQLNCSESRVRHNAGTRKIRWYGGGVGGALVRPELEHEKIAVVEK